MAIVKSDRDKGVAALVLLALVFASMGLFVRFLNTDFSILQQTYLRIITAFILGLAIFFKDLNFNKITKISKREWGVLTLRSVALYALGVTLISKAIVLTKYSNASFIGAVPITTILGFFLLREKITARKIFYVLVAFIGVVLIAVKDYGHIFSWGYGELLAFIAAFFFSLSYVARKWHTSLLNNKEIAVLIFFIASILLVLTSTILFHEVPPAINTFSMPIILAIVGAGLFNVVNLFLTNYGFQKVEAVVAGNILTLETLFAVILGFLFYQEIPAVRELIGGALIVFGVYQMNRITS